MTRCGYIALRKTRCGAELAKHTRKQGKAMGFLNNSSRRMFNFLTAVSLMAAALPPSVRADGGNSGGGGDYLDQDLLDRVEFGKQIDPRREFAQVYSDSVDPILEKVRKLLPELADDLDQASRKPWFQSKAPLAIRPGTDPGAKVQQALKRGLYQTKDYVLVSSTFPGKPLQAKSDGLIHEGVRNLVAQGRPYSGNLDPEERIRQITMKIANLDETNVTPALFRQQIEGLGLGHYLTAKEMNGLSSIIKEFRSLVCDTSDEYPFADDATRERVTKLADILIRNYPHWAPGEGGYEICVLSSSPVCDHHVIQRAYRNHELFASAHHGVEFAKNVLETARTFSNDDPRKAKLEEIEQRHIRQYEADMSAYSKSTAANACSYLTQDWFKAPGSVQPSEDSELVSAANAPASLTRSLASLQTPSNDLVAKIASTQVGAKTAAPTEVSALTQESSVSAAAAR